MLVLISHFLNEQRNIRFLIHASKNITYISSTTIYKKKKRKRRKILSRFSSKTGFINLLPFSLLPFLLIVFSINPNLNISSDCILRGHNSQDVSHLGRVHSDNRDYRGYGSDYRDCSDHKLRKLQLLDCNSHDCYERSLQACNYRDCSSVRIEIHAIVAIPKATRRIATMYVSLEHIFGIVHFEIWHIECYDANRQDIHN